MSDDIDIDSLFPKQAAAPAQNNGGIDLDSLFPTAQKHGSVSIGSGDETASPGVAAQAGDVNWSDVGKSGAAGVRSGVEGLLGLPGALSQGRDWLVSKALQKVGRYSPDDADKMTNRWLGWSDLPTAADIHAKANSLGVPDYTPQTKAGEYARSIGEFVPGLATIPLGGEGVMGAGLNAAKYAVAPGVASQLGGDMFKGTPAEPWVRAGAGLLGGLGAAGLEQGVRAGVGAGKQYLEPLTVAGQKNMASRQLQDMTGDLPGVRAKLEEADLSRMPGRALGEDIEGSKPTLGQLTGDRQLLSNERSMATADPTSFHSNEFGTGAEQQNAARSAALQGIQPDGSPEAVGSAVRQQLAAIEAQHDADLAKATQAAKDAADAANTATGAHAAGVTGVADATRSMAQDAAQQAASGIGRGATPEELGSNLRTAVQSARDAAKTKERALWKAVDPDGTLAMPAGDIAEGANKITSGMASTAKPMAGEESAIFDTAANMPEVAPFNDVTALRSRISTAMREELRASGQTPTYARLAELRDRVEGAISAAVENKAAVEARAVARGEMSPEETMVARWKAEADAFQRSRAQTAAGANSGEGNIGFAGSRPASVSRPNGAEIQGRRGFGDAAGTESVSLTPNLDEAAAERLKAASTATRERAQTFDQGPVGSALKTRGQAGDYAEPASGLPAKAFAAGPKGAETANAFGKAAGTMQPVADIAAESLRREAMTPEGIIDPAKFAKWKAKHQDALRALPAEAQTRFESAAAASRHFAETDAVHAATVKPLQDAAESLTREAMTDGMIDPAKFAKWKARNADALASMPPAIQKQLSTAESASEAVTQAAAARKAAVDGYQKSVVGKFLGPNAVTAGADVTKTIGQMLTAKDGVRRMSELAAKVAHDPDAVQGLRKAIADYIISRSTGATEAGASGVASLKPAVFKNFIRDNRAAIKAAGFTDEEINTMHAIGQDMQRGQRTMQATKLPGNSNTAQDVIHAIHGAGKSRSSIIETLMYGASTAGGFGLAGIPGAIVGGGLAYGKHVLSGLRNAGIRNAAELVREGILNPEMGKTLLLASPYKVGVGSHVTLANELKRVSMFGTETPGRDNRKHRASGGSVKKKLSHEELVARLMSASEKAKNATKRDTKALLGVDDNTVAKALAVAQKAI